MSRFARLAVATTVSTMILIALGGVVRAMEAGLGCPDWPTCYGAPNPPSELAAGPLKLAWIEHSHRLWASVVMGLIVALAVAARRTDQPRAVRRATLLLVPAVVSQALLGALVVWAKLDAETVTLHLAGALTILALSAYVVLHATGRAPINPPPRGIGSPSRALLVVATVTASVTFAQMLLGSSVTGYDAGLAFTTFPSFQGRLLPALAAEPAPWLHVAHRALAYTLAALFVVLVVQVRRRPDVDALVARLVRLGAVLVILQIGLGAANIWWRLSAWTVVPHLVVGSWIWLVSVLVVLRTRWQAGTVAAVAPDVSRAEQLVSR